MVGSIDVIVNICVRRPKRDNSIDDQMELYDKNIQEPTMKRNTEKTAVNTDEHSIAKESVVDEIPPLYDAKEPVVARSGRTVNTPTKYDDYIR